MEELWRPILTSNLDSVDGLVWSPLLDPALDTDVRGPVAGIEGSILLLEFHSDSGCNSAFDLRREDEDIAHFDASAMKVSFDFVRCRSLY